MKFFIDLSLIKVVKYFEKHLSTYSRDMTFLLGFYVSRVVQRWWDQYKQLPMPDTLVAVSHALVDFRYDDNLDGY